MISRGLYLAVCLLIFLQVADAGAEPQPLYKPYVMGSIQTGTISDHLPPVRAALEAHDFAIVGRYSPYDGAEILAVTSQDLREGAAASEYGGYGAALRVSLTQVEDGVQIAYTNPVYLAHAYRLPDSNEEIAVRLEAALGAEAPFGSREGMSAEKLRKYHYTVMMPYFDDQDELARYGSHQAGVEAVEAGLAAETSGVRKIYRIDVSPDATLFGVAIGEGHGADHVVMENCDREAYKHTAYMPYEILVQGDRACALPGKFRIALSFPDLSMGTFMKISRAPGGIKGALKKVARSE